MDLHGFVDIRVFRVRLPERLPDNQSWNQAIEVCRASQHAEQMSGWLGIDALAEVFPSQFSQRNLLNIPGPIYGAETDTCCTGPEEAPNNVLLDNNGQEFVFKQASSAVEFRDLVAAARSECFVGYGADGDVHWRLSLIRDWWRNREEMLAALGERWLAEIAQSHCKPESVERRRRALLGGARGYLRVYGFFVENGRAPTDVDILPDID